MLQRDPEHVYRNSRLLFALVISDLLVIADMSDKGAAVLILGL